MSLFKSLVRRCMPQKLREMRRRLAYLDLLEGNLFIGLPGATKRLFVRNAWEVLRYPTFIETGTFEGAMAAHAATLFSTVHTIEVQPELAHRAKARFAGQPTVAVHKGDSGSVLRELLPRIETPCVFWLDAHYSGGVTGRAASDTPILDELRAIAAHPVRPHAIFIDDARMFGIDPAYPDLQATLQGLREIDPDFKIGVCSDVIWASPVPLLQFEWRETEAGVVEIPAMDAGGEDAASR